MAESLVGRVIRTDAKVVHVDVDGRTVICAPRGRLFEDRTAVKNPVAVGDRVRIDPMGNPAGLEEVLPRTNTLSRIASSHDPREQVLAANVDRLFIVSSLARPGFSSNRTDRILASCQYNEIPPALILNKIDLVDEESVASIEDTYQSIGVPVLRTCAVDGRGIDELRKQLRDRVSMFYGASGAGKSSILNAIQPGLKLREGKVSKYWKSGRHTTSFSQMHRLDLGGYVVDTPGIRVFRLFGINKAELRDLFVEFEPYAKQCRYANCSHDHEPECALFDAVETGKVAASRYASYVEILDELGPPPADDTQVAAPDEE